MADKVLSTRLDESIVRQIGNLAQRMGTSKKHIIERAVLELTERIEGEQGTSIMRQTSGAWSRKERPQQTVEKARAVFRASLDRRRR